VPHRHCGRAKIASGTALLRQPHFLNLPARTFMQEPSCNIVHVRTFVEVSLRRNIRKKSFVRDHPDHFWERLCGRTIFNADSCLRPPKTTSEHSNSPQIPCKPLPSSNPLQVPLQIPLQIAKASITLPPRKSRINWNTLASHHSDSPTRFASTRPVLRLFNGRRAKLPPLCLRTQPT
jgi:hypothetical protein